VTVSVTVVVLGGSVTVVVSVAVVLVVVLVVVCVDVVTVVDVVGRTVVVDVFVWVTTSFSVGGSAATTPRAIPRPIASAVSAMIAILARESIGGRSPGSGPGSYSGGGVSYRSLMPGSMVALPGRTDA
jgi:hypothetical protein